MEWRRDPGSFRDPSGFVFTHNAVVYRQVNAGFAAQYAQLTRSGLYDELVREGLLVAHDEVQVTLPDLPPAHVVLQPTRIPFISYPYEWCFGQYKAAALLTLELQRRALERGMMLRDASAYNVQFVGSRPIFIDTLSFGPYVEGEPWSAYRQFCQHFLNPLALMALIHPSLSQLMRAHIDGIPLDVTAKILPFSSRLRPGVGTHVHLHARSAFPPSAGESSPPKPARTKRMGKTAMMGLIDSLSRTVQALSWRPTKTLWSTYTDDCNYSESARHDKERQVTEWFDLIRATGPLETVWDFGANIGNYSRIAADHAPVVVAFDSDQASVERLFNACRGQQGTRVLPLVQDLLNPSPAIGWHHAERRSLAARGPADVGMALALVHHLAIGANVPLPSVALFLADVCRRLVVEFVPREDSQVKLMLARREDIFADYSQATFEAAFAPHFKTVRVVPIKETVRTLYLLDRRSASDSVRRQ